MPFWKKSLFAVLIIGLAYLIFHISDLKKGFIAGLKDGTEDSQAVDPNDHTQK